MIPFDDLLASGLPLVERWFLYSAENRGYPRPLCVVGPSLEHLERYANALAESVRNSHSLHLPVGARTNLKDLIEAQWRWSRRPGDAPGMVVLCLPPLQSPIQTRLPRGLRVDPLRQFSSACQTLALAPLMDRGLDPIVFILVDDAELQSAATRQLARHISTDARVALDRFTIQSTFSEARWDNQSVGLVPGWCWTRAVQTSEARSHPEDEQRAAVLTLSVSGRGPTLANPPGLFYMRALTPEFARLVIESRNGLEHLMAVYGGTGERNEDDRLVPMRRALQSGWWTPTQSDMYLGGPGISEATGHRRQRLETVCEQIDIVDAPSGEAVSERQSSSFPLEIRFQHTSREVIAESNWLSGKAIRFRCSDPRFLRLTLNDDELWHDLRCRFYGSYETPRVDLRAIRETSVPWPDRTERLQIIARFEAVCNVIRDVSDLGERMVNDLPPKI